ncbi:MAG: HpcH/HpaI aldolase/citrate lyase family protein [Mangrovibacterium sp.]
MKGCSGQLKKRIKAGDTLLMGCIMDSRSGSVVEMYHETGYDAILIDREHSGLNSETILEHIRLCRVLEIPCMVRVAEPGYAELNRTMDQAPDGIVIPRIRTRKEVENVMEIIRFPPQGVKGYGASTCPAGKYVGWKNPLDQLKFFYENFVVGIQIETAEALDNLDSILSVSGIDIAVVGNDDLSLGMGIPAQFDSPEYLAAVKKIISACTRHNVLPGIACGDPVKIKFWKEQGMRVFWAASDIMSMWLYTKQNYEAIREQLSKK